MQVQVIDQITQEDWWITPSTANQNWPAAEFEPLRFAARPKSQSNAAKVRSGNTSSGRPPKAIMSSHDVGKIFMRQWKDGLQSDPTRYPDPKKGMSNADKDQILRNIAAGMQPHQAFVKVLHPNNPLA